MPADARCGLVLFYTELRFVLTTACVDYTMKSQQQRIENIAN